MQKIVLVMSHNHWRNMASNLIFWQVRNFLIQIVCVLFTESPRGYISKRQLEHWFSLTISSSSNFSKAGVFERFSMAPISYFLIYGQGFVYYTLCSSILLLPKLPRTRLATFASHLISLHSIIYSFWKLLCSFRKCFQDFAEPCLKTVEKWT